MDLIKYKDYTTDGFVNEEGFWLWVLENDEEQQQYWLQVLQAYPEKQQDMEQAKRTILELNTIETELPASKVDALWGRILASATEARKYPLN